MTVTVEVRLPTFRRPRMPGKKRTHGTDSTTSKPHDVVPAVDVDHFAGDATAGVGGEEDSG